MDEFQTIAKLWPAGTEVDLGTDSNLLAGAASFTRNAADYVTSPDGTTNYRFLFWNTGRHVTSKRRVRWNFSVLGWGTWTATRWYGTPPGGGPPGPSRVRADAFGLGNNSALPGTPIDPSSTYAVGAWPTMGDDHVVDTTTGAASVIAKDPYPGDASSTYDFAGWLALTFGGDSSGEYIENDMGMMGGLGSLGTFEHVAASAYPVAKGANASLVATYGTHHTRKIDLRKLLNEYLRDPHRVNPYTDPSPEDRIRLRLLTELLADARPEDIAPTDFQQLIATAPTMSREELKRSVQSLNVTLDLGKSALSALEAQLKRDVR